MTTQRDEQKPLHEALADAGFTGPYHLGKTTAFRPGDYPHELCPKCGGGNKGERTLSLTITPDDGAVWMCWRHKCGWTGNVPGRDRVRDRGYQKPPPAKPKPPTVVDHPAGMYQWFEQRGITRETVDAFGCFITRKWFPQTQDERRCIAWPYRVNGEVVNHKYRAQPKHFMQDKNAWKVVFNRDCLDDDNDVCVIVEGEIDVMTVWQCAYPTVISLPDGAPQNPAGEKPERNAKRLQPIAELIEAGVFEKYRKVIIATDMDEPGVYLAEEVARRIGKAKCFRAYWPDGCKDSNETLLKFGADAVVAELDNALGYPVHGLVQMEPGTMVRHRAGPKHQRLRTGFVNIDHDGIFRLPTDGRLFVVTGIPNSGKSEFVDALAVRAAQEHGWTWAVCSPENNPVEEHVAKLLEKHVGRPYRTYWQNVPAMDDAEVAAGEAWVNQHFSFILPPDDTDSDPNAPGEFSLDYILGKAKIAVVRHGIKGLIIDPWNEIEHAIRRDLSETQYTSYALSRLKRFGADHAVNVFLIAHPQKLRREGGDIPIPGLYDISGSAHFANKADFGLTVHRPKDDSQDVCEIHVTKIRFKGFGRKGAKAELFWDKYSGRYLDTPAVH